MSDNLQHRLVSLEIAIRAGAAGPDVLPLAQQFYAYITDNDAAPNEKPKTRRSKTDTAPADGAAFEPSSPNASKLEPADEPKQEEAPAAAETVVEQPAGEQAAGPTRDDAMTAAVKFSTLKPAQGGGEQALADVLQSFKVERFSLLPADQYGAFIKAMDDREEKAKSGNSLLG